MGGDDDIDVQLGFDDDDEQEMDEGPAKRQRGWEPAEANGGAFGRGLPGTAQDRPVSEALDAGPVFLAGLMYGQELSQNYLSLSKSSSQH